MARVKVLAASETIGVVDVKELLRGREPPVVDSESGCPTQLRSFVVNEDPKMVVVPNFLTSMECSHLRELANGHFSRSLVGSLTYDKPSDELAGVNASKICAAQASTRTSVSCMLRPAQTHIMDRIEHRLAGLAKLPLDTLERTVVVRYHPGQQFSEHHDGKFRPLTVFVYLNELEDGAGGDTFFPHLGLSFIPREGCAVLWPNATLEGGEDSRMVHAGRAPIKGVKYGINCFFNNSKMRLLREPDVTISPDEAFRVDVRALLTNDDGQADAAGTRVFALQTEPVVSAVPRFASDEELFHLLSLLGGNESVGPCGASRGDVEQLGQDDCDRFFPGAARMLHMLEIAETPTVESVEKRLAQVAQFPLEHLGRLRIMRAGTTPGMCNRGCGQKAALLCLSERDEVVFPHLGVRLLLQRGDLLIWPNAWQSGPISDEQGAPQRVVEDMRTKRYHLHEAHEGSSPLSLDVCFHDTAVRTLWQDDVPCRAAEGAGRSPQDVAA